MKKSRVEQYIEDYTKGCSNELDWKEKDGSPMYESWLIPDHARAVAQIAREEVIENLWKDAQGDDLPEIDREVVAFTKDDPDGYFKIVIAHRPNPDGYVVVNGEKLYPEAFDKGGWNMPDVKYWLDVEFPFKEEDGKTFKLIK